MYVCTVHLCTCHTVGSSFCLCWSDGPQQVTVTPNPAVVALTQSLTLTCQADGFPKPTLSWRINGNIVNGDVKNTLTIANAAVKDAGNYTCVARNDFGTKETTRVVNVECEWVYY